MFSTLRRATIAIALSLAPAAHAQSINLDLGDATGVPAETYGGAANRPGFWNIWNGGDTNPFLLLDLGQSDSRVYIRQTVPFGIGVSDSNDTFGDDEALFDDYITVRGGSRHTISGLAPGEYEVFIYAWPPDNPVFQTLVAVNEIDFGSVSGDWPGTFVEGVTHARGIVPIRTDEPMLIQCFGIGFATINGIQLVQNAAWLKIEAAKEPPFAVPPDSQTEVEFIISTGDEQLASPPLLHTMINGQPQFPVGMTSTGPDRWRAALPLGECLDEIDYYVEAVGTQSGSQRLPYDPQDPNLPTPYFSTTVGYEFAETLLVEGFENGIPEAWTANGLWHATSACAPFDERCEGAQFAYYGNDELCDHTSDVFTQGSLFLPTMTFDSVPFGTSIELQFCQTLETEGDGSPVTTRVLADSQVQGELLQTPRWAPQNVDLTSLGGLTTAVEFRLDTDGRGITSYRGWQIDDVRIIQRFVDCTPPCEGDVDLDRDIDLVDLATLLTHFGTTGGARRANGDLDADGDIELADLARLLTAFGGSCPIEP
ncbi:MAG: hypothetical protein ACKVS9_17565 [Phycisphaerae bacterium]